MQESNNQTFNHLKIHTQYSICEGAVKIEDLKIYCKDNKIKSIGLCDTSNLCGALEFAEKISKSGTQPIIGTQIKFKVGETFGLLPLFALNEIGYKNIINLSSTSYLKNDKLSDPHVEFKKLLSNSEGVALFSGTFLGLFGQLFEKGKFTEIHDLYSEIKKIYGDRFYIEIQRHKEQKEIDFEKFNLNKSLELEIPIIATNEVFYLYKDMHEAHDALICIGNKTYVNEKNSTLKKNINSLEKAKDQRQIWRKYVNQQLKSKYKNLYSQLNCLIYLRAKNFSLLQKWRLKQERKLWVKSKVKSNLKIMSRGDVINFMQTYQRITQNMFKNMPKYASIIFNLNSNHQIKSAVYKSK